MAQSINNIDIKSRQEELSRELATKEVTHSARYAVNRVGEDSPFTSDGISILPIGAQLGDFVLNVAFVFPNAVEADFAGHQICEFVHNNLRQAVKTKDNRDAELDHVVRSYSDTSIPRSTLDAEIDRIVRKYGGVALPSDRYIISPEFISVIQPTMTSLDKKFSTEQQAVMKYDPQEGTEKPYPSHAKQYRDFHPQAAWLFNPWTGQRRLAGDVGSDLQGNLIASE